MFQTTSPMVGPCQCVTQERERERESDGKKKVLKEV
jgi:hypothetical protein